MINEQEDSDSDEEDQPLALMNGARNQTQTAVPPRHGGKKTGGHMTVAGTAPAPQTGTSKGPLELKPKPKQEELGEAKIQRLATGITVDTEGDTVEVRGFSFLANIHADMHPSPTIDLSRLQPTTCEQAY